MLQNAKDRLKVGATSTPAPCIKYYRSKFATLHVHLLAFKKPVHCFEYRTMYIHAQKEQNPLKSDSKQHIINQSLMVRYFIQ